MYSSVSRFLRACLALSRAGMPVASRVLRDCVGTELLLGGHELRPVFWPLSSVLESNESSQERVGPATSVIQTMYFVFKVRLHQRFGRLSLPYFSSIGIPFWSFKLGRYAICPCDGSPPAIKKTSIPHLPVPSFEQWLTEGQ